MNIKIDNHNINTSHEDKVLFDKDKITKGDVIEYYRKISEFMLPYLNGRPVMMERYPDGIGNSGFFQKDIPDYFPDWISRVTVKKKGGGKITHILCDKEETLAYLANQGCITIHSWLSRADHPEKPDKLIMDLDPPGDDFQAIRNSLSNIKDMVERWHLDAFIMTTGSKGLHLIFPVLPEINFDEMKVHADELAEKMCKKFPEHFTTAQQKKDRHGLIYLDTQRNSYAQTGVTPFSMRPKEHAPVATPVTWEEAAAKDFNARSYHIKNIFRRLSQVVDPWSSFLYKRTAEKNLNHFLNIESA